MRVSTIKVKMMRSAIVLACISLTLAGSIAHAAVIYVDDDNTTGPWDGTSANPYQYIQDGMDTAISGDTVIVKNGLYKGASNVNLDFKYRSFTVKSQNGPQNCIIDCENMVETRAFTVYNIATSSSVIDGFTIRNGNSTVGGGIYCWNTSLTIQNNIITSNWASYGGGMFFEGDSAPLAKNNIVIGNSAFYAAGIGFHDSAPTIEANEIVENSAEYGGGVGYYNSFGVKLINNVIARNSATLGGGGVGSDSSAAVLTNNTFAGNIAYSGVAIGCYSSTMAIVNTIVWEDELEGIYLGPSNNLTISYSDIKGGQAGVNSDQTSVVTWSTGNINADPMFLNAAVGDYRLSNSSPCIGGGTSSGAPTEDIDGNPRPDPFGSMPDIGAYENALGVPAGFNNIPVAYSQSVPTDENTPVSITLTGSDLDSDPLDFIVVSDPSHGSLSGTPPNLVYDPDLDFNGYDSFTFKVNDGADDSNIAKVVVIVGNVLVIQAKSPVDMIIEDPLGQTISKAGSGIPGASYTEYDINGDSDPDDEVLIPYPLKGVYSITIVAEVGASLTDTYTLDVAYRSYSVTLANSVQIQDIPAEPYGFLFYNMLAGWYLFSLPLQPSNTDPAAVLLSIEGKYDSVWAFDPGTLWSVYAPSVPSDLTVLEANPGYWIKMDTPGTLIVHGVDPADTAIFLEGGEWNLVGFSARMRKTAVESMQSVEDYIDSVWEYDPETGLWYIYAPGGASDLDYMKPGFGYWILADQACFWDVNAP